MAMRVVGNALGELPHIMAPVAVPLVPVHGVPSTEIVYAPVVPSPVHTSVHSDDAVWRMRRMVRFNPADPAWRETVNMYHEFRVRAAQSKHLWNGTTVSADTRLARAHEFVAALERTGIATRDLRTVLSASFMAVSSWKRGIDGVPERVLACLREASGREHALYLFYDLVEKDVAEYRTRHPHFRQALELRRFLKDAGKKASELGITSQEGSGRHRTDRLLALLHATPPDEWREAIARQHGMVRVPALYRDDPLNRGLREAAARLGIPKKELARHFGVNAITFRAWSRGVTRVPARVQAMVTVVCGARDAEDLLARVRAVGAVPPAVRPAPTRPLTKAEQGRLQQFMETYGARVLALARSRLRRLGLGDDARGEELAQDVWLALANRMRRGEFAEEGVRGWLFRVVQVKVIDHARTVWGRRRHGLVLKAVAQKIGREPTEKDLIELYNVDPDAARAFFKPRPVRRHVPLPEER